jgi:hypothetical protein
MGSPWPLQRSASQPATCRRCSSFNLRGLWLLDSSIRPFSPLEANRLIQRHNVVRLAPRFEPWPGPVARLGKDLDPAVSGQPDCARQSQRHEGVGPCGRSRQ